MEILKYIEKPELLDEATLPQIRELLGEYPYFQTLHLLLLKNLDNLRLTKEFNEALRKSALYVGDRRKLFFLLNQKNSRPFVTEGVTAKATELTVKEPAYSTGGEVVGETNVEENEITAKEELITEVKVEEKQVEKTEVSIEPEIKKTYEDELILIDELQQIDTYTEYSNQKLKDTSSVFAGDEILLIDGYPDESFKEEINEPKSEEEQKLESKEIVEEQIAEKIEEVTEEKEEKEEKKEERPVTEVKAEPVIPIEDDSPIIYSGEYRLEDITEESEEPVNKDINLELIDNFIRSSPKIIPDKSKMQEDVDISQNSVEENDEFITERLAEIYLEQKLYAKAIYTYEKLCLKIPEKSTYFEVRIAEIKKMINK